MLESNRDYYLRRAQEESAKADGCSRPDMRERHLQLARLLLSIAGDHEAGPARSGIDRTTVARLEPGFVILPGGTNAACVRDRDSRG